jgi:hypothetical protein
MYTLIKATHIPNKAFIVYKTPCNVSVIVAYVHLGNTLGESYLEMDTGKINGNTIVNISKLLENHFTLTLDVPF